MNIQERFDLSFIKTRYRIKSQVNFRVGLEACYTFNYSADVHNSWKPRDEFDRNRLILTM
jgi:hypothetical protein